MGDDCHSASDVMILNYAIVLAVARDGMQCNTQGVWPCKLPIDSLSLQLLAMSPDLMEALRKQSRRKNFINTCNQETHVKKSSLMRVMGKKIAHDYDKFEMSKIITNDAPCTYCVTAQRPIFNLIGNIVTRLTWTLESFRF